MTIPKPRILIVDDNVELLEELKHMLELGGYDVLAINDGSKAFDAALKNKPDLILLDLKMSPKSGFQIADEFTNSMFLKDVPIIAMTGFFTEKQHLLMMKLCGIKTSILKPFRPVNLISKIEFALGNRVKEYDSDGT
ncbi:MAG: response regulator transcription factor [Candidatus Omnitrophica bacterium]|nr:response regulator transcription factor [Candidatus Omnitrophota bacterium]